eukprot:m.3133 g.3133  ORF g.3133 m.3133 type:complete len:443 (+) comp2019_c0_seq1:123-1451(+)
MNKVTTEGGKLHLPNFQLKIQEANNMEKVPNFWQPGVYKNVVAKVDDGAALLDDLSRFVLERAHIEKKYAQMLASWSKKWNDKISKCAEEGEGTLKPAWKSLLSEANQLSVVHSNNDQRLRESVQKEVTTWKKSVYSKQIRSWKITKETHDMFHKAQKPWSKGLKASKKAKKAYFSACEARDQARKKVETAQGLPEDEVQKLEGKLEKAISSCVELKEAYKNTIDLLQQDKPRYEVEMKKAFDYCEDLEQKRQEFFKEMFICYHGILSEHTPHQTEQMKQMIDTINPDADVLRYRRRKGPEMPLCVPPFQEFGCKPVIELVMNTDASSHLTMSTTDILQDDDVDSDDDWDDDDEWTAPPDVATGRPVRAIYDYVAEEEEEISLRVGDVVTLIAEEDEQGWCKGVHPDGSAGLFPACYVEDILEEEVQSKRQSPCMYPKDEAC